MDSSIYTERRAVLRNTVPEGAILLVGNLHASRNYGDNVYPFRQDSNFLYYTGLERPELALLITPDGRETLYGPASHPDDTVWFGPHAGLDELAATAGIGAAASNDRLATDVRGLLDRGSRLHLLPPYRGDRRIQLAGLLGTGPEGVDELVSRELVAAVVDQRSVKSPVEVAELEDALEVTAAMYRAAFRLIEPGRTEAEIAGAMQGLAISRGRQQAFLPIVSVRGEVLHNESWVNTLADGDLLVMDCGAESPLKYAADITRTVPVSGRFSPFQRDVYQVVLGAQLAAIEAVAPGRSNREVHLTAARAIARGLRDLGLMRGDVDDAVEAGAHALFFPHGIGHMLGLDSHDMEDLGDSVGYADGERRSEQFGLNFLRLARTLESGFVVTIEPGVYFIPALIDRWEAEGRHREFVCYERLGSLKRFGGVRIEDDVLVTPEGRRVLGPGIPKAPEDVEAALRA